MDYNPRIIDLYDEDNPDGPDHDFYRSLAADATRIVDVGCGTGILTVTLAGQDSTGANGYARTVIGVDPSKAMLDYARRRPGAENVIWVQGDSRNIPMCDVDLAIMSGNVAQHIPDSDWRRTLTDLRQSMVIGGILSFESRNPEARAWESWSTEEKTSRVTQHGELVEWTEISTDDDRVVQVTAYNHFVDSDDLVTEAQDLVFRSRGEIESDLEHAGFRVKSVYGGWEHEPFDPSSPIMVFVAQAR